VADILVFTRRYTGAILFMLTLIRRETTFGLGRKSSFVEKRGSCTNQQQRKTVSHPTNPHSPDVHVHVGKTANLM
jgi:hypothetical protein